MITKLTTVLNGADGRDIELADSKAFRLATQGPDHLLLRQVRSPWYLVWQRYALQPLWRNGQTPPPIRMACWEAIRARALVTVKHSQPLVRVAGSLALLAAVDDCL